MALVFSAAIIVPQVGQMFKVLLHHATDCSLLSLFWCSPSCVHFELQTLPLGSATWIPWLLLWHSL